MHPAERPPGAAPGRGESARPGGAGGRAGSQARGKASRLDAAAYAHPRSAGRSRPAGTNPAVAVGLRTGEAAGGPAMAHLAAAPGSWAAAEPARPLPPSPGL